uniref:Uncharacterized protein n=1 Tax=Panagrolaimus sp. ES5 TaxID=591445 RepID=A0AC34GF02_9BILA
LPEIAVNLDQSLVERIDAYLKNVGIEPTYDVLESSKENPMSLIVDRKLAIFDDSEPTSGYTIGWAPPMINWNAWRQSNIDDQSFGMKPLEQISADLKAAEDSKRIPEYVKSVREKLPVYKIKNDIINAVKNNPVTLIKGATGCGKSTQVCQYLLEEFIHSGRGAYFNAFCSQPRRISAITLAERVAEERGEQLGDSVGFAVRFEAISPRPYGGVMFV